MALNLTQEDLDFLKQKGINPEDIVELPQEQMGMGSAVGKTLAAHAGSYAGGGAGALAGGELGALGGPAAPITVPLGAIIGGLAGAYAGQKGQQAVLPASTEQSLEEQAQLAAQQHPWVSLGTDITAGALTSGGSFSPKNILSAGRGLLGREALTAADQAAFSQIGREALSPAGVLTQTANDANSAALRNVLLQSAINPAIAAGTSLATTGHLPSGKELLGQTVGGALFSSPAKWAQRFHGRAGEPSGEPTTKWEPLPPAGVTDEPVVRIPEQPVQPPVTPVAPITPTETQPTVPVTQEGAKEVAPVKPATYGDQLTEEERQELLGGEINAPVKQLNRDGYYATIQHDNEVPGSGYVQIDEVKNGENVRSLSPEKAQEEGIPIPSRDELTQLPQGKHYLGQDESGTFLNPRADIGNPVTLMTDIQKGTATTGSVLQHLANAPKHPFSELAKELLDKSDKQSLAVPWSTRRITGVPVERSNYSLSDRVGISFRDVQDSRTVMEEAIHSMTSKKLQKFRSAQGAELKNRLDTYIQTGDNEALKDIAKAYLHVADRLGYSERMFKDSNDEIVGEKGLAGNADEMARVFGKESGHGSIPYIMGNLDEFIAGAFKDKQFQNLLNEMENPENPKQTMWQKIVDSVRRLLGLDVKQNSMLDRILRSSTDLISQERPQRKIPTEYKRDQGFDIGKEEIGAAPKPKDESETKVMGPVGRFFQSGLDKIRAINHPDAKPLAAAFQKVFQTKEHILGQQLNPIMDAAKSLSIRDKTQLEAIQRYELERHTLAPETMFQNPRQKAAYDAAKTSLRLNVENRIKNQEPIMRNGRPSMPTPDPTYWPTTTNPETSKIIRDNSDPVALAKLKDTFTKYQTQKMGVSPEGAISNWNDLVSAIQGKSNSQSSGGTFFNASRKEQGVALPPEMTRPGWDRNLEAYFHAQSTDNAYYEHIEKNPQAMASLGETKDAWGRPIPAPENGKLIGNKDVRGVVDELKGEANQNQTAKKIESLATTAILGPQTEMHVLVSNLAKLPTLADNPYQGARVVAHAISNIAEGWTHAKENGKLVMTAKSAGDMFNSQLTMADRLAGLAKGMRDIYTLGGLTTKLNAGLLQAGSEALVPFKIKAANEGNPDAVRMMKYLDPDWVRGKDYSPSEISQLASNLTGSIHGTHDARTLPVWMTKDNELSAFFKLSSWGIAQTNSFMRDVYTPALRGNFNPLLQATMGAAIGGYAIKELREKLSGKKSQIPSLQEIASSSRGFSGNIPAVAYNMMAASSYAGMGGMLSTLLRYPFDMAFRNTPQGATFPLDTVASDLASTISHATTAIANDPNLNWGTLTSNVLAHVLSSDFQLARIVLNHGIDSGAITGTLAEKKNLSDKLGQLRRFQMVEGLPYEDQGGGSENPYMNLEQKKFKLNDNLDEAMKQLPQLVNNIVEKYSSKPDLMFEKLKSLKQNSYSTFPSMQDMPISFMKYVAYLTKMEGPDAAQGELRDYMEHRIKNEVKASVVP